MSLHHNMFPRFLIFPQIVLLRREVRRGRGASSSPSTRYTAEPVSFLAFKRHTGRKGSLGKELGCSRESGVGIFFHIKGVKYANPTLFRPALLAPEPRAAAGTRGGVLGCCCPALLLPALPGRLLSRFSPERHARSGPSRGGRREEKGSVVFLSSFPRLPGLLTGSDSPDGHPRWLSGPLLLQGPRPWRICLCPDWGKEGEKEEKGKPQTSFESQFVGRAWSARRRRGDSGI